MVDAPGKLSRKLPILVNFADRVNEKTEFNRLFLNKMNVEVCRVLAQKKY
jgi:hypothetical protein